MSGKSEKQTELRNKILHSYILGYLSQSRSSTPISGVCDRYRRNQSWSQRSRAQNGGYGEQPLADNATTIYFRALAETDYNSTETR